MRENLKRNHENTETLKTHTNSVIDLERYSLLHDWKASDAASLVVQSIFTACVFPNCIIGLDTADANMMSNPRGAFLNQGGA